jgi:hypothetical protein
MALFASLPSSAGVIRHVVVARFKPDTTEYAAGEVVQKLRELPSQIPVIRGFEVGLDMTSGKGLAIVGLFDDRASFEEYMRHSAHRAVADEFLVPITEAVSAMQFET